MKHLNVSVMHARAVSLQSRPIIQALTKVWSKLGVLITGQGPDWLAFKPSSLMLKDIEHLLTLDYKKADVKNSGWVSNKFSQNGKDLEYHLVAEYEDQVFLLVINPKQGRAWITPKGAKP